MRNCTITHFLLRLHCSSAAPPPCAYSFDNPAEYVCPLLRPASNNSVDFRNWTVFEIAMPPRARNGHVRRQPVVLLGTVVQHISRTLNKVVFDSGGDINDKGAVETLVFFICGVTFNACVRTFVSVFREVCLCFVALLRKHTMRVFHILRLLCFRLVRNFLFSSFASRVACQNVVRNSAFPLITQCAFDILLAQSRVVRPPYAKSHKAAPREEPH